MEKCEKWRFHRRFDYKNSLKLLWFNTSLPT